MFAVVDSLPSEGGRRMIRGLYRSLRKARDAAKDSGRESLVVEAGLLPVHQNWVQSDRRLLVVNADGSRRELFSRD